MQTLHPGVLCTCTLRPRRPPSRGSGLFWKATQVVNPAGNICAAHLHNSDGKAGRDVESAARPHFHEPMFSFLLLPPPLCSGKGYSSRASGLNQSDLLLSGGSVGQLALGGGGGGVYLPDYSVRQITDLQVLKVTKTNAHTPRTNVECCWNSLVQ